LIRESVGLNLSVQNPHLVRPVDGEGAARIRDAVVQNLITIQSTHTAWRAHGRDGFSSVHTEVQFFCGTSTTGQYHHDNEGNKRTDGLHSWKILSEFQVSFLSRIEMTEPVLTK
jgi:hypothetical protein